MDERTDVPWVDSGPHRSQILASQSALSHDLSGGGEASTGRMTMMPAAWLPQEEGETTQLDEVPLGASTTKS